MTRKVTVHLLPTLFSPEELQGGLAVVIDVLRASTTVVHALAAGAHAVIPCAEVNEARRQAANLTPADTLLGGERKGRAIEGFHVDNSPLAYTQDRVSGKTIVFTTTNGTRALIRSRQAEHVFIGAFSNLHAVLHRLLDDPRPIHLVCAGTNGKISQEDCLCAGAIAAGIASGPQEVNVQNDSTQLAMDFFQSRSRDWQTFLQTLQSSAGGRNVLSLGQEADLNRAAQWDLFDIVPEYRAAVNCIHAARTEPAGKQWLKRPLETN